MRSASIAAAAAIGVLGGLILIASAARVEAQPSVVAEDFEGNLAQWTGKSGGSHYGVIVADPLNPNNHCLTFTSTNNSGDIFSMAIPTGEAATYVLRFDYLGLLGPGGLPQHVDGYIGVSSDLPGQQKWLGGVCEDSGIAVTLAADGLWHSYSATFSPSILFQPAVPSMRVMIEEWDGAASPTCAAGIPGASMFDNITLAPEGVVQESTQTWGTVKGLYR
jgi:hypothetical protein